MQVNDEVDPVPVLQLVLAVGTAEQLLLLAESMKYPSLQVVQVYVNEPLESACYPSLQFVEASPVKVAQAVGVTSKAIPAVQAVH